MKVLFIGGTGIISSACSERAIAQGMDLYLLSRGQSQRTAAVGAKLLQGDIHDRNSVMAALGGLKFDAVVDWVAYTPEQVENDLELFRGRTGQYIFISSASAYQTPPASLPVTESTILDNPIWEYSRNKIACEELLVKAYRQEKYPITIVRPSHTYDRAMLPIPGGFTTLERMRRGKPVIVHGDGTSLWTLTHHVDFAKGFVGLLGNSRAIGEAVHITGDEWLSWNQIFGIVAQSAGVQAQMVHIPSDLINAYDPVWGAGLLGDKANSMVFDNSKIKRLVPGFAATIPFSRGAEEIVAYYDEVPGRVKLDAVFDAKCDQILSAYQAAWPKA